MRTLVKNALLAPFNMLFRVSPRKTLEILFRLKQRYSLNLDDPRSYNEKLQWIKLYDRNPLMPVCCDKYRVREYVEDRGWGSILNELYWSGFDPDEIPFDDLPDSFVIKVTHGSTFNIIVKDKALLDREDARARCRTWLKAEFLPCYGEWFYGVCEPRVIVERYLENPGSGQLYDYKLFVMNGATQCIRLDVDRFSKHKNVVYDSRWNRLPGVSMGFVYDEARYEEPACLDRMLSAAERLAEPFHHARVDFYVIDDEPVFGEITFTNGAGFDRFQPYEFDLAMGESLSLPIVAPGAE